MNKQKQRYLHDPEKGSIGDCYRTAIACMLDMHRDEVPHFLENWPLPEDYDVTAAVNEWLAPKDLKIIEFPIHKSYSLSQIADEVRRFWLSGGRFMLTGKSPRGTDHVVIIDTDGTIWDPAIQGGDLVGPDDNGLWWVTVFVPLSIHGRSYK